MSLDPKPPTHEKPSGEMPSPPSETNDAESPELRPVGPRRFRKGDVEIEEGDEEDGEVLVVSVRLRPASSVKKKVVEPEEPEPRLKASRFAARSMLPPPPPPGFTLSPLPPPDDPTATPPGAPRVKFTPRTAQAAAGKDTRDRTAQPVGWIKYFLPALAALAVGYLAGGRAARPVATVTPSTGGQARVLPAKLTTPWAPAKIAQLDAVLADDEKGDLKGARQLALDLKKDLPDSPDVDLYLATLQVRLGEFKAPENDLAKMIDSFTPPREAAAINAHLGFVYTRSRDFPLAVTSFTEAASTDPFNPSHFQHWAEALRREGQLQEAIGRFRQALVRLPAGQPESRSAREDIELKIRLSQIEMGKDEDVKTALDAHLKEPSPTGPWLLTAAAYALQHGDMGTAVSALQRARAVLPDEEYSAQTNDYFFHSFSGNADVASLLPADTPAVRSQPFLPRMGYFVDP